MINGSVESKDIITTEVKEVNIISIWIIQSLYGKILKQDKLMA